MKLNIDFFASTPNGPSAGITAVLRSPTTVKIEAGDDGGHVTVDKVAFEGRVVK